MRILHVYKTYYPYSFGGIEKCIESLCVHGKILGIDSQVLSIHHNKTIATIKHHDIQTQFYPKTWEKFSCPVSWALLKDFSQYIQAYDLIHYHFPWPFADVLNLISRLKKPYIITYHSDIVRQKMMVPLYLPLMRHFLGNAKAIVATSQNYVDSSPVLKKIKQHVKVVPIGLEDKYSDAIVGHSHSKPYFLFVGVLREYKGLHYLVEAMQGVTEFDLIIAGDGACFERLQQQITQLKLDNVKMLGRITETQKYSLYKNAYAVVSSAHQRNEAYCYMLVEGLMFGKPLISTDLQTGTTFVNQANKTGLVVSPADVQAMREAMQRLFNHDQYAELARNARERFDNYFTVEKMVNGYRAIYQKTLA